MVDHIRSEVTEDGFEIIVKIVLPGEYTIGWKKLIHGVWYGAYGRVKGDIDYTYEDAKALLLEQARQYEATLRGRKENDE